jgi:hypothetical protein
MRDGPCQDAILSATPARPRCRDNAIARAYLAAVMPDFRYRQTTATLATLRPIGTIIRSIHGWQVYDAKDEAGMEFWSVQEVVEYLGGLGVDELFASRSPARPKMQ